MVCEKCQRRIFQMEAMAVEGSEQSLHEADKSALNGFLS